MIDYKYWLKYLKKSNSGLDLAFTWGHKAGMEEGMNLKNRMDELQEDLRVLARKVDKLIEGDSGRMAESYHCGNCNYKMETHRCDVRFKLRTLIYRCCLVTGHSGEHMAQ